MSGVTISRFWGEEEIKVGAKQRNLTSQLPKRRERGPEGKTPSRGGGKGRHGGEAEWTRRGMLG